MAGRGLSLIKSVVEHTIKSQGYGKILKNVEFISAGEGSCKAEFTVDDEHLNNGGTLHGGCISTLIDCVSTYALMTSPGGSPGVSVDLNVSFMKAAFKGDRILIDARTIRAGRTLAFLEAELTKTDNKAIIARGTHTKFIGK